jgi:hypothetical protein
MESLGRKEDDKNEETDQRRNLLDLLLTSQELSSFYCIKNICYVLWIYFNFFNFFSHFVQKLDGKF